ncbi:MAG: alpha-E domain-containing protein [Rhodothermales bacterium]
MLSRVADSLYWMSRYLERAEHTARVLNVNLHGLLDQKDDVVQQRWRRVARSLYMPAVPDTGFEPYLVAASLTFDARVPGSIVNSIVSARQNAREIREQISTEMWEQINRMFLHVQHAQRLGIWDTDAHAFFQAVRDGSHLFQGMSDTTLSHDEGWLFIQLGRYIERVQSIVRLLGVHFDDPAVPEDGSFAIEDYMEWVGLLKSCTAFEAYCRLHTANIQPDRAMGFLLLHPSFPHSVHFGIRMILSALEALSESIPLMKQSEAYRQAGKLASSLQFDPIGDILAGDVQGYLEEIHHRCLQIHDSVFETCITYPLNYNLAY